MRNSSRQSINLAAALAAVADHPSAELTLSELVRAYCVATLDDETRLRKWLQAFGQESAWAVKPDQLQRAAQALLDHGYKPSAVNRDLSALGSAYRWARDKRLAPRAFRSPTLDVPRYEEAIRRVHVEVDQLSALRASSLAHPDRRFGVFVALLMETGARKSELLERRWREVDLDRGEILAPVTKNGAPRVLFFRPDTAALMRRIYPRRDEHVLLFEGRIPNLPICYRKAWLVATREAGLPALRMHDLRHAAAASLLRAGVTLPVAAQVLGHDPAVLARRYGHLETNALRLAQEQAWNHAMVKTG